MKTRASLSVLTAVALAVASCTPDQQPAPVPDAKANVVAPRVRNAPLAPLAPRDFLSALDRWQLHASSFGLDDDAFQRKLTAALASPFHLFRAFAPMYYFDLRNLELNAPGYSGPVCGDPHPDNFGFLRTAKGTEYAFDDYDDSGRGPVAFDALRYFTALRLEYPEKESVFDRVLDSYVARVPHDVPASLAPSWDSVRARALKRFTKETTAAPPALEKKVKDLAARDPHFHAPDVQAIGLHTKDYGGSGGAERVWILVSRDGVRTVLEMKEALPPAIDQLGGPRPRLTPPERLALAKSTFLAGPEDDNLFTVSLDGKWFLVRDRARMSNVDLGDLSKDDRREVLDAQAAILARVHAAAWAETPREEIRTWLSASSETLAKRWRAAYDAVRAAQPP